MKAGLGPGLDLSVAKRGELRLASVGAGAIPFDGTGEAGGGRRGAERLRDRGAMKSGDLDGLRHEMYGVVDLQRGVVFGSKCRLGGR